MQYTALALGAQAASYYASRISIVVEVKKTCVQRPSQVLASAVWTAYLDLNKR
jgi:hypothetical protein